MPRLVLAMVTAATDVGQLQTAKAFRVLVG